MPLIRRPDATEPDPAAPPAEALRSPSADARWSAVRALGDSAGGLALLIEALGREREPHVLEAIFTSLARNQSPEAIDALVGCVRSDDAVLRTGAMDALRTAPAVLGPRLAALLDDADADVRLLACDLARALPPAEAAGLLCRRLAVETEANVCAAAVETLAEIGEASAGPALAACAERFADEPFLKFAITEAARRLSVRTAAARD